MDHCFSANLQSSNLFQVFKNCIWSSICANWIRKFTDPTGYCIRNRHLAKYSKLRCFNLYVLYYFFFFFLHLFYPTPLALLLLLLYLLFLIFKYRIFSLFSPLYFLTSLRLNSSDSFVDVRPQSVILQQLVRQIKLPETRKDTALLNKIKNKSVRKIEIIERRKMDCINLNNTIKT